MTAFPITYDDPEREGHIRQVASAWERSTAATKAANNAIAGLDLRNCS
jgi:hypothetical protein